MTKYEYRGPIPGVNVEGMSISRYTRVYEMFNPAVPFTADVEVHIGDADNEVVKAYKREGKEWKPIGLAEIPEGLLLYILQNP